MNRIYQPFSGKSISVSFWVIGLASLPVIALWWSGTSTALAQEGGEGESDHSEVVAQDHDDPGTESDEGRGEAVFDPQTLRCIIQVLGRVPSGIDGLTNAEKLAVGQQCFGQHDSGLEDGGGAPRDSGGSGDLDDETFKCIVATIGRVPASGNDITAGENLAIGQQCFGEHGVGLDPQAGRQHDSDGSGGLDEETFQCVVSVLGRVPANEDDFTNEEKRAVGLQCFGGHDGGSDGSDGPGDLTEEDRQCIISVLGRMPTDEHDLSHDEKLLLGQECFAGQFDGDHDGPDDLDQETLQCIVDTIGRLPAHENDLTDQEERLIGQACFGGGHGGPDDLDEETLQCIVDLLGYLPSGPDDLTEAEKMLIGMECFGDDHGGPDDLDQDTIQCIVDFLGYLPSGPDDLTDAEKILVGRECFGDDHGGPGDPDEDTIECIVDLLGYLPSGPDDMTNAEKVLVGQECFGGGSPDDLDEETRQCIIDTLGYLPAGPEELEDEEMDLVVRECFEDEHEGTAGTGGLDQETLQCIVATIGRLPSGPSDLSTDEKRLIGRECFGGGRDGARTRVAARGLSEENERCIVDLIGRFPDGPDDLTEEEKLLIGRECFEHNPRSRNSRETGVQADLGDSQEPATGDEQSVEETEESRATGGGQTSQATDDDQPGQETEDQQATSSQQEQEEETGAAASQPPLVLTESQQKIKDLILEHNVEVKEMEVIAVIGRLASQAGSLTKGIQVLSIVNHLVLKGKEVTDEEFRDVFEQLEESGIELR